MAIDWNVKNANSRDVERQHLNKILADIRATVDSLQKKTNAPQSDVHSVVGSMVEGNTERGINVSYNAAKKVLDFVITNFTISLTGDVSGTASVNSLGNVSIDTTIDESFGIDEAPEDGLPYWRINGDWEYVGVALESLSAMTGNGFAVIRTTDGWITREFEVVAGELTVTNQDGEDGNPTFGIADLADSGTGTFKLITRDGKGRLEGTADGFAIDIPYDNTTSGLTAEDVQAALDELATSGSSVTISDSAPLSPSVGAMWFDSSIGALFIYYDDGTSEQWVQIGSSGGSGGSVWNIVKKTADESRANTVTLAADSHLHVTLSGGTTYRIKLCVLFEQANATMDMIYGESFTGTYSSRYFIRHQINPATSAGLDNEFSHVSTTGIGGVVNSTVAGPGALELEMIINVTTGGVYSFTWAQNVSNASNLTVKKGSYLEYTTF